jgi:hypothetical protein
MIIINKIEENKTKQKNNKKQKTITRIPHKKKNTPHTQN